MPKFHWEGKTRNGETRKGVIEAQTEDAVAARLRADGLQVTKIKKGAKELSLSFGSGIKERDIVIFTRQLATMIDAGLPLVQCLDILAGQAENKNFGKTLYNIKANVEQGANFSESMRKHPKVFDELYVNLVAAGEVGGILDTILHRLSSYIEKAAKLKRQVKSAMNYPIAIMSIAAIVVIVLLTKVIPVFENMFAEMKAGALPKPTQIVINLSKGFVANWHYFAIGGISLSVGFKAFVRTKKGRDILDGALLKAPVLGPVLRKSVVARFTRTLGTLLSSGVPILDSLEICAKTSGNKIVEYGVMYAREKISEGKDLAGPLADTKVFPTMVVQMIGVGEQTGAMDAMLQKIADFYEDEVDVAVAGLTALMEPIMMVFLGTILGGIIVAMYLPIFELAGGIGKE
jgi:type IV pilus assembly protein PilC